VHNATLLTTIYTALINTDQKSIIQNTTTSHNSLSVLRVVSKQLNDGFTPHQRCNHTCYKKLNKTHLQINKSNNTVEAELSDKCCRLYKQISAIQYVICVLCVAVSNLEIYNCYHVQTSKCTRSTSFIYLV